MSGGQVKNSVQDYLTIYFGQVNWQQDKYKFDLTCPRDKWKFKDFFTPDVYVELKHYIYLVEET